MLWKLHYYYIFMLYNVMVYYYLLLVRAPMGACPGDYGITLYWYNNILCYNTKSPRIVQTYILYYVYLIQYACIHVYMVDIEPTLL